jgi:hypothetical protein
MFDTTSTSLGIGVTGTDHPSSNLYITGNAYVSSNIAVGGVLTMGTVNVVARHDLESVTATGNITPLTVEFTNATTGIVATGNVEVGGNVVAGYLYGDGSNITGISSNLQVVTDTGNVTSNTVQFSNATTGLVTTANVEVGGELTVSGNTFITTGAIPRAVGGTPEMGTNLSVTGSVVTNVGHPGSYKVHTFNSSGTLNVDYPGLTADVLMIGGGGGGGYNHAGAGGGGGYLETRMFISGGVHNIVIGAGGTASTAQNSPGTTGNDTYAFGIIAAGGGGGGSGWSNSYGGTAAGQSGASGGGGSGGNHNNGWANNRHSTSPGYVVSVPGYNPYVNQYQGGNGGQGHGNALAGGGGGGAGGHGQNASGTGAGNSSGGNGGNGIASYISGTSVNRGGGGGGGAWSGTGGTGNGGGGNGHVATNGTINTGGGGGGGGNSVSNGGAGGSGVVIIRYLIPT